MTDGGVQLARDAQAVLREAIDRSPNERGAFLDIRCAERPELRVEVDSLLQAHKRAEDFLERPALAAAGEDDADPMLQRQVGRYRVESVIAAGGMGTVYRAVQDNPHRTVALKVLRPGVSSRSAMRRFRHESHLLARLQHPNIAQVYDAGTLDGLPYFAMEHVADAMPITAYARDRRLSTRQRLELFVTVCDAVHHGHLKGIIHRDLKPDNILVDAAGRPKIIDFGVARATDADIAITTLRTDVGQLIGTLQYMSPEQCEADPDILDTRSDVYSLGVVLYELICDTRPYDLGRTPVYEATRVIRDQPPVRPSTISRAVRGDLETIVMRALEKDRERRYPSAADLADDIGHFLRNEPIQARPPTMLYQMRLFARRHRGLVGALAAVTAVLVAASAVSVSFAIRAEHRRQDATWRAYVSSIAAADSAYLAGSFSRMRQNLEQAPPEYIGWEWHYLDGLAEPSLVTLGGHDRLVSAVAFSPDGRRLVSASWDRTIILRDADGENPRALLGHDHEINDIVFSPDGSRLASASRDATVRIWDVETGETLRQLAGHDKTVWCAAFTPDGTGLLTGSRDGTVRLWDAQRGELIRVVADLGTSVTGVAVAPDGRTIATSSDDRRIRLWDLDGGETLAEFEGWSRSVAFSPDGRWLAAACFDTKVRVWDTARHTPVAELTGHGDRVWSVAFSPGSQRLASGSADDTILLWSTETWTALPPPVRGHEDRVHCLDFSPDGSRLITGSFDDSVRLWDVSGARSDVLDGHTDDVVALAFSPDGTRIVSGSWDRTLIVRDTVTGERLARIPTPDSSDSLAYGPDGLHFAHGRTDGVTDILDADTGQVVRSLAGHADRVGSVAFRPDGLQLATGAEDGTVRLWSLATGDVLHEIDHDATVQTVAYSGDGRLLASSTTNGVVTLFDARTARLLHAKRCHDADVFGLAFSPDGTRLASGSWDKTVHIMSTATGETITRFQGTSLVHDVAFSPDGTRLVCAQRDQTLRLWDVQSGREVASLHGHGGRVAVVVFSPDGTRIASGAGDRMVRLWDTVPVIERFRERASLLATYDDARSIIDRLITELIEPSSIAAALRTDPQLDPWQRRAALNLLMRRSTAAE